MTIRVKEAEKLSLEEIRAFLGASEGVGFEGRKREEMYEWVNGTLRRHHYERLRRSDRGLVRRYVRKMTGLSRAQTTRLIGMYLEGEEVKWQPYRRRRFPKRYTREDIAALASMDEAHATLSGPATKKLLERAHHEFGEAKFERLARISVAQLYRLRGSRVYREKRVQFQKTRPTKVSIGERRRPEPEGRPGYLRIDTVHQGDGDGVKGVYHINVVDEVTQYEILGAVPTISEAWLLPVLEGLLRQFPFRILGFHSDNGSEFINYQVAGLLEKLRIDQTKSRPRRSNDNGQVEAKNGAVVRKHMGYVHIAAEHAAAINEFYEQYFNPYLNYHRPCGVPELVVDKKGKQKRIYPRYATPWEILRQTPDLERRLREGVTIAELEQQARAMTDLQAAEAMQAAKRRLFASIQASQTAASCLPSINPGRRLQMENGTPAPAPREAPMGTTSGEVVPAAGPERKGKTGLKTPKVEMKDKQVPAAAVASLPLVGPEQQSQAEAGKTKDTKKRKPTPTAAVARLPLVGPKRRNDAEAGKIKDPEKGKPTPAAAVARLPLVGPEQQSQAGAGKTKDTEKGKPTPAPAVARLPLVGPGQRSQAKSGETKDTMKKRPPQSRAVASHPSARLALPIQRRKEA